MKPPEELLREPVELIDRLRDATADFLDQPGEQPLCYNSRYAHGMILALQPLGQGAGLGGRRRDEPARLGGHLRVPWVRVHHHGESRGCEETHEITGTSAT